MKPSETCKTCAAFSALCSECRRHAPQPVTVQTSDGRTGTMGIYPETRAESWCLEWRADPNKLQ